MNWMSCVLELCFWSRRMLCCVCCVDVLVVGVFLLVLCLFL